MVKKIRRSDFGRKVKKTFFTVLTGIMCLTVALGGCASPQTPPSNNAGTAEQGKYIEDYAPEVNNLTGIADVSLSGEALNAESEVNAQPKYADDDRVTVIVKLKDRSMLDRAVFDLGMKVEDYALTPDGIDFAHSLAESRDGFIDSHSSEILSVGYRYSTIFNGFAADIRYGDLASLEGSPAVDSVIISETYLMPQTITENDVNVYGTGIYDSSDLGYDGTGTVVAILDTGLDFSHTAFQNQPTGKLALDRDGVSSVFNELAARELDAANTANAQTLRMEDVYISDKVPFAYDYADKDSNVYPINDHGTHVAGIIAGKDEVITGVATQAQLAIFKVFGNEDEGAKQDDILAALNDAILLGVDAINMSLGSSCGFSRATDDDNTNEIYDSIKEAGICLIVAASNSYSSAQGSANGDTNLLTNPDSATVGSPATYDAAMAVASISGVKTKYLMADGEREIYFTEGAKLNGDTKDFVGEILGSKQEGTFDYVVVPGVGNDSNYSMVDVNGKIAVVKRGVTTFEEKIKTAKRRGAIGVIIYNNVSGTINMSVGNVDIPACSISMDYGLYLESRGQGTLHLSTSYLAGPFMSNFSSWGPKAELELTPDITAHGGEIYSAVRGGYDTYSGTSMACPNMAGATILVREYVKENYPKLTSYEITELTYRLMMSTATIAYNEEGNPYSPRKQGAGLADIGSAIDTLAYLYVDGQNKTKLSLGDDVDRTGKYTLTFKLANLSPYAVSYNVHPIVMTESVSSDGKTVAEKAHLFDDCGYTVSVKGGSLSRGSIVALTGYSECEITVELNLTAADKKYLDDNFANGMYVEGFVELQSYNEDGIDLNIPYLAFYGDWTVAPMLDVTAYEVGASQEDPSVLEDDKLVADVYGTVPMGGFRIQTGTDEYDETYYYLGAFGYNLADGYEQPAILEDKAAISNNINATYSLYCIAAGLLRNAKYAEMQIVDSLTGEVVFSKRAENCRKSYSQGGDQLGGYVDVGFYVNEHNLANNRKYTYSMVCYLDYDEHEQKNLKNTFSFSFYVDNEAPRLVEENTRIRTSVNSSGLISSRVLNMYVYDNHYIQGMIVYTYSDILADGTIVDRESYSDGVIPVDTERNETTTISLDITNTYYDILDKGGKLLVTFIDYAKNQSTYSIDLNGLEKPVTQIEIKNNRDTYNLGINRTIDLHTFIDVYPQNTWTESLVWTSSDENVATVLDGVVTGVSVGTTEITVSNKEGTASQKITINVVQTGSSDEITLTALELKATAVSLERGEKYELTVKMHPYNITEDIHLTWTSPSSYFSYEVDPEDQTKVYITALQSGSGTITVRADGKTISASCRITVKEEFEVEGHYLRSYTGRGDENGVVTIPDDLGITIIYNYVFYDNDYITKIIFPDGVEQIMEAAVYGCENLVEVVLPDTLNNIGRFGIAWNPKLEKINLENVTTIGDLALYNSPSLKHVDLTNVYFLGERAFGNCTALEEVDLSNVVYMGDFAFALDSSLRSIITGDATIIGNYAFAYCELLTEIEINSSTVGTLAFGWCTSLKSVTFNNSVDVIGYGAFYNCTALESMNFRSGVRVIDDLAFAYCSALGSIIMPAGLEELGINSFAYCTGLTSVTFSKDALLTHVGIGVFVNCTNLTALHVEDGAKYLAEHNGIIYDKAFKEVKLVPYALREAVVLPSTVLTIGEGSFSYTRVSSVSMPSVEIIEDNAFYYSQCNNIYIGDNVKYIGDKAFYRSFIKQIDLPEGLEYIGSEAFVYCIHLDKQTLVLPESLTYVADRAFAYTNGIEKVEFNEALDYVSDYMFYSSDVAEVEFKNVRNIGSYAFAFCTELERMSFPDTVEAFGAGVFRGCTNLSSVTLPSGIESIPAEMFYGCTALNSVEIPDTVTIIGQNAFYNVPIESFDFKNVEQVYATAFVGTKLTAVEADKLTLIGSAAFANIRTLAALKAPMLTTIYNEAFYGCSHLVSNGLNLPKLEFIGAYAFAGTNLSEFKSDTVTEIEEYAFANAASLIEVDLPALTSLGEGAFSRTGITSFTVGADLAPEDPDVNQVRGMNVRALSGAPSLAEIKVAEGNGQFVSSGGVLYRKLTIRDGRIVKEYLELVAYPVAKADAEYTVADNTIRIAEYAFYGNNSLTAMTLPKTLKSIGASAFEQCNYLTEFNFLSVDAPVLEGLYEEGSAVSYRNFVTAMDNAGAISLHASIPKNGMGYDTYIWNAYFASIEAIDEYSEAENTIYLVDLIDALPAVITEADRADIELARLLYGSFTADQKAYVTNIAKLEEAERQLAELEPPQGGGDSSGDSSASDSTSAEEESPSCGGCGGCGGCKSSMGSGLFGALCALGAFTLFHMRRGKKN